MSNDVRALAEPWLSTPPDEPDPTPPPSKADGSRRGVVKPKPKD
jgi:hypothetical protein